MTENKETMQEVNTFDDLLNNPFDVSEPLLPEEMQTKEVAENKSNKLIDRLSDEEKQKHSN